MDETYSTQKCLVSIILYRLNRGSVGTSYLYRAMTTKEMTKHTLAPVEREESATSLGKGVPDDKEVFPPPLPENCVALGGIQVRCRWDPQWNMFRVSESRGKALSSGGFGVTIPSTMTGRAGSEETGMEGGCTSDDHIPPQVVSPQYLFIEEVLFLYERGVLECVHHEKNTILQSAHLYDMLPKLQMSLPMYLVYAHLRDQDFRVLRHNPERYPILKQQENIKNLNNPVHCAVEVRDLRHQVRVSVATASAPRMPQGIGGGLSIAWDVYQPSAEFAKTHPGFPDFYVAAAFFNVSFVHFCEIADLMKQKCHGIPLKIATVSDSGTVVMFGATDFGVPTIGVGDVTLKEA